MEEAVIGLSFVSVAILLISLLSFLVLRLFYVPIIARWISYALGLSLSLGVCIFVVFLRFNLVSSDSLFVSIFIGILVCVNFVVLPVFYFVDKKRAISGSSTRIPEKALHSLAIFGGAVGAVASQRVFRHKTKKRPFQVVTWVAIFSSMVIYYLVWRSIVAEG